VKTGGRLIQHARYYWLLLAESHLTRRLFAGMLRKIAMLPAPAGLGEAQSGANFDDGAGDAGRSVAEIDGENTIFGRRESARRETGHFRNYWEHCGTKSAKALHRKAVRATERLGI